jgi:Ring finger domain
VCEQLQMHFRSSNLPLIRLATSCATAEAILDESEGRECPVCMECFKQGDLVSWSSSEECHHVFHHSCIKAWLIHHECCPYCRLTMLSVDKNTSVTVNSIPRSMATTAASFLWGGFKTSKTNNWTQEELRTLAQQRHQRISTTYYCLEEGLIALDRFPAANAIHSNVVKGGEIDVTAKNYGFGVSNRKCEVSLSRMKSHLATNVQPGDLIASRVDPKNLHSSSDVVVTVNTTTSEELSSVSPPPGTPLPAESQDSHSADIVVEVEMCLTELTVISDCPAVSNCGPQ